MTHRDIEQRYADLPIDLSDERLVRHLVRAVWAVLSDIDPHGGIDQGKLFLAHATLKGAVKALVPERAGDTIAADSLRRAIRSGVTEAEATQKLTACIVAGDTVTDRHETIDGHDVIFEPSEEGGYTAFTTDLDGCVSEGDTLEEARRNIAEAIELYLAE